MERNCPSCNKRYVTSKQEQKDKREAAPIKGDEQLCSPCLKDICQIAYDQSYFGSIGEWGAENYYSG